MIRKDFKDAIQRIIEAVRHFIQRVYDIIMEFCRNLLKPKFENKSRYIHGSNKHNFYKSNVRKSQVYSRKPIMLRCRSII